MGIVYRALDRLHGVPCAVKMLEVTTNARRFLREARILARLTHPAIVRYVGQGIAPNGNLFLAMEWVEGTDLERRLQLGPLTMRETVALARRLGEALSAVHAEGIVHRDLKPSNVFLPEGKIELAKLGDFGIAHTARTSRETGTLTQTGMILGTPGYLAPEQLRAASADPRTDLFGLGCILFECLTGRPAFSADTLVALLAKIAFDPTPRLRDVRPDAPEPLDALLGTLLAKDIEQRPRSAAAVLAALETLEIPDADGVAVEARVVGTAERRLVPVVVCPGPELDIGPSETQALFPSRSALFELGTRAGVRLELLPDGSVIGVLDAVAESATEQALRAARLARELAVHVAQRPIAIAMGRVVVASGVWVSEVVEQAMRLLQETPKGTIVLDDDSSALLEARFEVRRDGSRITLGDEQAQKLVPRRLLGRATPFVGRRRELSLLLSTLEECVAESYARAMLVTALPGIGKSRLLSELLAEARTRVGSGLQVLVGRGDPALAGVPFGLLGDTIRRNAGIRAGDGVDDRTDKLRTLAGVGRDASPGLVAFLGEIAGLELPDTLDPRLRAARRDPPMMSVLTRDAFVEWLQRAAGDGGLLLALDDLHWADALSVQLVDAALGALPSAPLCVLVLGRPEVREAYPRLFDARDITELTLGRLSRRASEELVGAVLGGVEGSLLSTIVERAEGNAFFLEELIRAGAQGNVENLPDTVLGVMESRLADLESDGRIVLRAASVFGESCWGGAVRAVLGPETQTQDVDGWLATLAAREILVREPMSRFRGEREYGFRHALLRDASYASFDDADRRAAHRRAAAWLEGQGEALAAVLASHWERAGDVLRAGAAYVRAVEQALRGNDLELAIALVGRAERLGVGGEILGALRLLESEALTWMGAPERALAAAAEAVALLPRASASWYSAVATAVEAAMLVGRLEGAANLLSELTTDELGPADQAESRASALSRASFALVLLGRAGEARALLDQVDRLDAAYGLADPMTLAHRAHALAAQAMIERRREAAAKFYAAAADAFENSGALRLASGARTNVAAMYLEIGAAERALDALDGALELAERTGAVYTLVLARLNRAIALGRVGRTDEAIPGLRAVLDELTRQGDRRLAASAGCALAEILAGAGDLEGAEAAAHGAIATAEGLPACLAGALATLAFVQLRRERPELALTTARAADAQRRDAAMEERETLLELVLAEAAFAAGDRADARERVARLARTLASDASAFESAELRRIFLERLPESLQLRELERAFAEQDTD